MIGAEKSLIAFFALKRSDIHVDSKMADEGVAPIEELRALLKEEKGGENDVMITLPWTEEIITFLIPSDFTGNLKKIGHLLLCMFRN